MIELTIIIPVFNEKNTIKKIDKLTFRHQKTNNCS